MERGAALSAADVARIAREFGVPTGDAVEPSEPAAAQVREDVESARSSGVVKKPPNTATAGYGIAIGNRDGWWGHTGEIPGYNTTLYHNYEDETTIIVIVNSDILLTSGVAPAPATQAALQTALGLN